MKINWFLICQETFHIMKQIKRRLPLKVLAGSGENKKFSNTGRKRPGLVYQAGVLKAMEEARLQVNQADGISGGVFNLMMPPFETYLALADVRQQENFKDKGFDFLFYNKAFHPKLKLFLRDNATTI